jgi:hypothetical protein
MERPEGAWLPGPAPRACLWTRPYVMGAVFLPLSLLGGLFPSFSLAANLYVLVLGAALMVAGMSSRVPRIATPPELPESVAWWLVPVGLFMVVEVATYAGGSGRDSPTLSLLADPLLDGYALRSAAYFGWLVVFWGLVRR